MPIVTMPPDQTLEGRKNKQILLQMRKYEQIKTREVRLKQWKSYTIYIHLQDGKLKVLATPTP
jgi:hypothetical protein